jgi:hypothetical protein
VNVSGIQAITSTFKSRLSPLQFPAKKSVEQRLTSLERGDRPSGQPAAQEPAAPAAAAKPAAKPAAPLPGRSRAGAKPAPAVAGRARANTPKPVDPDAHFNQAMKSSADLLQRTAPPGTRSYAGATPAPAAAGRARANTPKPADPDAHFRQVMKSSADVLQRTAPPGTRSFAGATPSPATGGRSRAGDTPTPSAGGRSRAGRSPAPGSDAHFDAAMSRSANLLAATRPDPEAVRHQQNIGRLDSAQERIRSTAALHRSRQPLPEERLEDRAKSLEATHSRVRAEARLNTGGSPAPAPTAKPAAKAAAPAPTPAKPGPTDGSGQHAFYNQDEDKGWTAQVGAFRPSGVSPDGPLRSARPAPAPKKTALAESAAWPAPSAPAKSAPKPQAPAQPSAPAANTGHVAYSLADGSHTYHLPEDGSDPDKKARVQPAGDYNRSRVKPTGRKPARFNVRSEQQPPAPPVAPTPVKNQQQFTQDDFAPAAMAAPKAKPAVRRAPEPEPQRVSDDDWHSMLNDSVTEHKATKAAKATKAPAAKTPGVRQTTLTVGGKQHVVRTEHSGTRNQLEAAHTKAVKDKLAELRAPKVQEAQATLNSATRNGANKSTIAERKSELAKAKQQAAGYTHNNPVRTEAKRKPPTKVPQATKADESRVAAFQDGHERHPGHEWTYGVGKRDAENWKWPATPWVEEQVKKNRAAKNDQK